MEVNITLFVQMINFLVAWFLLRNLYFKPALVALDGEQQKHNAVVDTKHKWQGHVHTKQQEIESHWHMLKRFSKKNKPDITHPDFFIFKDIAPTLMPIEFEQEQLDDLSAQITDKIVSEVEHVDV